MFKFPSAHRWMLCLALVAVQVRADTNAITGQTLSFIGYVNGAAGFSFTPATNIAVTRVGYFDTGPAQPIVNFWSSTNYIFASYPLGPGSSSNSNVFTNVNLQLLAGRRYSVTVQDGNSTSPILVKVFSPFFTAPQLTDYFARSFIRTSNGFVDQGTNYYIAGPNFSFSNLPTVSAPPLLAISSLNRTGAVLSWPASLGGFFPQQNSALNTTNWTVVTNPFFVNSLGSNQITVPVVSNRFFRLMHP